MTVSLSSQCKFSQWMRTTAQYLKPKPWLHPEILIFIPSEIWWPTELSGIITTPPKFQLRRCKDRKQKRGKRAGLRAKLRANPHKQALPSFLTNSHLSLVIQMEEIHLIVWCTDSSAFLNSTKSKEAIVVQRNGQEVDNVNDLRFLGFQITKALLKPPTWWRNLIREFSA